MCIYIYIHTLIYVYDICHRFLAARNGFTLESHRLRQNFLWRRFWDCAGVLFGWDHLVNQQFALQNGHRNSEFSHWTWWFSHSDVKLPEGIWGAFFFTSGFGPWRNTTAQLQFIKYAVVASSSRVRAEEAVAVSHLGTQITGSWEHDSTMWLWLKIITPNISK